MNLEENLRIDINAASAEELCRLPGINLALAQRIVTYRQERGAFQAKEELQAVGGRALSLRRVRGLRSDRRLRDRGSRSRCPHGRQALVEFVMESFQAAIGEAYQYLNFSEIRVENGRITIEAPKTYE